VLIKQQWSAHLLLGGGGGGEATLRWRADNQKVGGRRAREKVDGRGRQERQPKNHPQLSNSLFLGKSEGPPSRGIGDHHTTRWNGQHGLCSRPCGERGEIKRVEETTYAPV
jgi:hypothetical protein